MRPRPGNEVSHCQGLSDWFSRMHGSQARPSSTLPRDFPARASGNKGLCLSRKVAEPPENKASTDGVGWGDGGRAGKTAGSHHAHTWQLC